MKSLVRGSTGEGGGLGKRGASTAAAGSSDGGLDCSGDSARHGDHSDVVGGLE